MNSLLPNPNRGITFKLCTGLHYGRHLNHRRPITRLTPLKRVHCLRHRVRAKVLWVALEAKRRRSGTFARFLETPGTREPRGRPEREQGSAHSGDVGLNAAALLAILAARAHQLPSLLWPLVLK